MMEIRTIPCLTLLFDIIGSTLSFSNRSSVNDDDDEEEEDETFHLSVTVPMGCAMACLIILAIVGNLLTIISYIQDRNLRSVYNTFILNLAVTDFLIGCVSMGVYSTYDLASYHWFFGYTVCKIWLVIDFTLSLESVLIVFILSVDRLLLLKMGPSYTQKVTKRTSVICIIVSWFLAFLVYSPAIIGYDHIKGEFPVEDEDCDVPFVNDVVYTAITAVLEFVVPCLAIAIINIAIYIEIRKRIKHTRAMKSQIANTTANQNSENDRTKRDVKAAKFLAALVLVFAVTWAPYTVTTVIISFSDHLYVTDNIYETFTWINWSKASINPFLYSLNSVHFRRNFQRLICCGRKGNKVEPFEQSAQQRTEQTHA